MMQFLEKLWKMGESIEILNLSRQKVDRTIRINLSYYKAFLQYDKLNFCLLAIEMSKTELLMNKHVHLRLSKLELIKKLMNLFWYDYVKPKYREKQNCVIWIQGDSLYT